MFYIQYHHNSAFIFAGENGLNHQLECPILSHIDQDRLPKFRRSKRFKTIVPEYAAILPLRILQLKEQQPDLWSRVNLLMDHVDDLDTMQKNKWKVT